MILYVCSCLYLFTYHTTRSMAGRTGFSTVGDDFSAPTAAGSDNDLFVHRPCHCGSDLSQKAWHRFWHRIVDVVRNSNNMALVLKGASFEKGENNWQRNTLNPTAISIVAQNKATEFRWRKGPLFQALNHLGNTWICRFAGEKKHDSNSDL